jgi:ribosomal-protein-alanine N-acetyltransferase
MTPTEMAALHARCFVASPRAWTAAEFRQIAQDADIMTGSTAYGFYVVRVCADEGEILTIAVDPATRNAGHGRALMEDAQFTLMGLGARTVFLEVADNNLPARALYARCGFAPVGLRRGYYAGIDAHVLRKDL